LRYRIVQLDSFFKSLPNIRNSIVISTVKYDWYKVFEFRVAKDRSGALSLAKWWKVE
jgi:hypothetical protein